MCANYCDCAGFIYVCCAGSIIRFNDIQLTPDPVKYPGTISLGLDFDLNADLPETTVVDLDMTKLGIFPIPLPCIAGLGAW